MFHRAVLVCAALAFGAFASPILAQQSVSVPLDPPRPVAPAQAEPPPPPLPPMPNARHRWVDVGGHHSARAAAKPRRTQHAAKVTRRSAAHTHRATKKHAAIETHRATGKHRAMQRHKVKSSHRADSAGARLSSKTIRRCHTLNYRQIMRSSDCRSLMKQELAGTDRPSSHKAERHKAERHKAERHKAAAHRQKTAAQHQKTTRSHHQATKQRKK